MTDKFSKRDIIVATVIIVGVTGGWLVLMALLLGLFSAGYAIAAWGILIILLISTFFINSHRKK